MPFMSGQEVLMGSLGEAEVGKKVGEEEQQQDQTKPQGSFHLIPQELDPGSWAVSPLLTSSAWGPPRGTENSVPSALNSHS